VPFEASITAQEIEKENSTFNFSSEIKANHNSPSDQHFLCLAKIQRHLSFHG
jgi:hypothetical protein